MSKKAKSNKRRGLKQSKQDSYTGSLVISDSGHSYNYKHHNNNKKYMVMSRPIDRVPVHGHHNNPHPPSKPPRHMPHPGGALMLQQSHAAPFSDAASLTSLSTAPSESRTSKYTDATDTTHNTHNTRNTHNSNRQLLSSQKLREKIAEAREAQQETMDAYTESYMGSTIYTDETRSMYSDDAPTENTETYTEAYTPSIFTDIDYAIDYANVGIKDIVWTQKLKYLKNRLMFLEKEIADLPTQQKRLDKLMLYVALEFLSINPDEKKANDRLVEWWDLHKYAWVDKHDPTKENTLLSHNWNEIGIPLTRDGGATPIHGDKTIFEDIYDNLKRTEWNDPFSQQHRHLTMMNKEEDADAEDDGKSVIPSTIVFDEFKYKNYTEERSYLMDATDFLNFLHRQTTGQLVRSKSGLVGYVNVTVEDKIAECTPWRLHRVFQTSAWNRLNYENNAQLMARSDDQREAHRIEINQLKRELQEYVMELDYLKSRSKSKRNSKAPSPKALKKNQRQKSRSSSEYKHNRNQRAAATWQRYVDRYKQTKKRYPKCFADRNEAWRRWSDMLDERDQNQSKPLTESQLWSYIDFARMSNSKYANWIWWNEPSVNEDDHHRNNTNNRHLNSETQYYDHQLKLVFTKRFAIVMDFNLFLFEEYVNPEGIQDTLKNEHSLLSLASSTDVVKSMKNDKDFYLNTSGKHEARHLQFRCDDDAQRHEWMTELDYQIHIVHDLLSIPNIKLEIADADARVWLPTPSINYK